jgi:hypothetical protein
MRGWQWLTQPDFNRAFVWRALAKTALLFILLNLLFALLQPLDFLGQLSIHNWLVPGRARLPYGADSRAYNLSLNNLPAMFATHEITQPKAADEFRVLFIGDSSVWGILLRPEETLSGIINDMALQTENRYTIRAYNLGHPVLALSKDLLILDHAIRYEPDMIVWLTTLRSFPRDKQFFPPLAQQNSPSIRQIFAAYDLDYDLSDARLYTPTFIEQSIIGQRRPLADWLRIQFYGIMWAATGIDQLYPDDYTPRTSHFEADLSWEEIPEPRALTDADLAFDIIDAAHRLVGDVPLLLVNEPIFISDGENSDLRYNLWYPRWAFDQYRALFQAAADTQGWRYLDLWDIIPPGEFTDSPVHLTPTGSQQLAQIISDEIRALAGREE